MTNNALNNINKNKVDLSKLENQYSTGKKIQRPSEDPVVAVRALRLRKNLDELNQYYERNIPDAKSWMDTTEGALTNVNTILTSIYEQFNQGANDTLSSTDRTAIVESLLQLKNQIYQEGNTNYAGRYVFTGYKTDTSLVFSSDTKDTVYRITEQFKGSDLAAQTVVTGGSSLSQYDPNTSNGSSFAETPQATEIYRIRLSYENLNTPQNGAMSLKINGVDDITVAVTSASDPKAYVFAEGDTTPRFIPETGEVIFPKEQYDTLRIVESIAITYEKEEFKENELRPEHYFNCTATNKETGKEVVYTQEKQAIAYDINFGQKLTVNTEGKDALTHTMAREIDEIVRIVKKVESIETQIKDIDQKLKESNLTTDQKAALTNLKESLEIELALQEKVMQETFSKGMTTTTGVQNNLNTVIADLGARYVRLELVEDRLSTQQVEFEDLLSKNEDADVVETVIKYTAQEAIYNASLSVASKISKNSLLDFI